MYFAAQSENKKKLLSQQLEFIAYNVHGNGLGLKICPQNVIPNPHRTPSHSSKENKHDF